MVESMNDFNMASNSNVFAILDALTTDWIENTLRSIPNIFDKFDTKQF